MSAYIVDRDTIDRIIELLRDAPSDDPSDVRGYLLGEQPYPRPLTASEAFSWRADDAAWSELGQALWQLNVDAVAGLYGFDGGSLPGPIPTPNPGDYRAPSRRERLSLDQAACRLVKAAREFSYQCSEEPADNLQLFARFEEVCGALALDLLRSRHAQTHAPDMGWSCDYAG